MSKTASFAIQMIRTIIIDDEPNSRETLELMLMEYKHDVEIADSCSNPQEAIQSIQKSYLYLLPRPNLFLRSPVLRRISRQSGSQQ